MTRILLVAGALLLAAVTFLSPETITALAHPDGHSMGGLGLVAAMSVAAGIDPDELKKAIGPVMTAFEEFKAANDQRLAEIEKKGVADTLLDEKLKKLESTLSNYEGHGQKIMLAEQMAKAAKDASDRLEVALNRLPAAARVGADDPIQRKARADAWCKSVVRACAIGTPNLTQEEQKILADVAAEVKALNVSTDTAGGYLAPTEYVKEIIKGVTELSPARAIVRVRTTANKAIQIPKRTGQFSAQRVSEGATKTETTGLSYGLEELVAPEMYALIDITNDMLEDSAFDMEAEIRNEATEQFAVREGLEFASGTGIGECEGILTASGIGENVSGSAATIANPDGPADGLLTLKHGLKTAYAANATWLLNRTTIGSVRKLKDAEKNYIWMPGIAQGRPNTIDGDPYLELPDMPSEGAGTYPIAYGDFRRAYTMVDRIAMEMLRDPYSQATGGKVRFIFRRRTGGKVTLGEAFRKLKCAAA